MPTCSASFFTILDKQEGFPTSLPAFGGAGGDQGGNDNTKGYVNLLNVFVLDKIFIFQGGTG